MLKLLTVWTQNDRHYPCRGGVHAKGADQWQRFTAAKKGDALQYENWPKHATPCAVHAVVVGEVVGFTASVRCVKLLPLNPNHKATSRGPGASGLLEGRRLRTVIDDQLTARAMRATPINPHLCRQRF